MTMQAVVDQAMVELGFDRMESFDSHDFIVALAKHHQRIYVEWLHDEPGDTPFKTVHSMLGKAINEVARRHGFIGSATKSSDIFGQLGSNCVSYSRAARASKSNQQQSN